MEENVMHSLNLNRPQSVVYDMICTWIVEGKGYDIIEETEGRKLLNDISKKAQSSADAYRLFSKYAKKKVITKDMLTALIDAYNYNA